MEPLSNQPIRSRKQLRPPTKPKDSVRGHRNYLTPDEVTLLVEAATRVGRHALRDSALILICYRHALWVSELIALRWSQLSLEEGLFNVERSRKGTPSVHKLQQDEITALLQLKESKPDSEIVFVSERDGALTRRVVHSIIARAAKTAGLAFPVHSSMLRHAKGHQLGSNGVDTKSIQAYFGHRNIEHSALYTKGEPQSLTEQGEDQKSELSS